MSSDGSRERRRHPRISLNARVQVRAAGSNDHGLPCRVRDASPAGVSLIVAERFDEEPTLLEVLTASGRRCREALRMRVVWSAEHENGGRRLGCAFEL